MVVRYSGGHQAGHNVVYEGTQHIFANFGSGTLQGCPTYWSKHCTFDPIGFINEFYILEKKIDVDTIGDPKIYIHNECPVTTPYEQAANQAFDYKNGTCGVGFGATIHREELNYHLHFSDLFKPSVLKIKLDLIGKYYNVLMEPDVKPRLRIFMDAIEHIGDLISKGLVIPVESNEIPAHPNTIYESSQGLLLDKDIGFFPHVTRSNVGRKGLQKFIYHYDEVWYVTRAYQTRHGAGPMTSEKMNIKNAKTEYNQENQWQGEFRRGILDLDLLKYAIEQDRRDSRRNQTEYLVITCLDQLVDFKYIEDGKIHEGTEDDLIYNISKSLGFKESIYLSRSQEGELTQWKGGRI